MPEEFDGFLRIDVFFERTAAHEIEITNGAVDRFANDKPFANALLWGQPQPPSAPGAPMRLGFFRS